MQHLLTLATLGELDNGASRIVIDEALTSACRDLAARGSDGKDREVIIKVKMRQKRNGEAEIDCEAIPKMPAYRTESTTALIKLRSDRSAGLLFRDSGASTEPGQRQIDDPAETAE